LDFSATKERCTAKAELVKQAVKETL